MTTTYSGLTSTTAVPQLVITAYDKLFEFKLRAEPLFRSFADKRPANVTSPGESVTLSLFNDFTSISSSLTETTTVDQVALPAASTVSITLNEYGNVALETLRLREDAISNIDMALANAIAFNCIDSVDGIVQGVMRANGVQVFRRGGGAVGLNTFDGAKTNAPAVTTVVSTDTIKSSDLRTMVATLRTNKVQPRMEQKYLLALHPYVSADLRSETGAAAWRDPHVYAESGSQNIWNGSVGDYEGLRVVENPRLYSSQAGAGSGGTQTRVFQSYVLGQQALAEAVNVDFGVRTGVVTDPLGRFIPIGWYGFAGWNVYRQEALMRYECASAGQPAA